MDRQRIEQVREDLYRIAGELADIAIELLEEAVGRGDSWIDLQGRATASDESEDYGYSAEQESPTPFSERVSPGMRRKRVKINEGSVEAFERRVTRARHAVERAIAILSTIDR